jgi:hypothetical protein
MRQVAIDLIRHSPIRPSPGAVPAWARLACVPVAAGLVVLAFWLGGGVVTDDFAASLVLTAVLVGAVGLAALAASLRWRSLALPLLATFAIASGGIGGYLAYTTLADRVVDEDVVVAAPAGRASEAGPAAVATGAFESLAHGTEGRASVIRLADGSRVLTLTGFETSAGPDLRVYLSPRTGGDVAGAVDLGGLKGNIGDQQYELPPSVGEAELGSVVIWCRAFSVAFGAATLAPS